MDKFSELIKKGVAAFEYKPVASPYGDDMVCRTYNNVYSIATDTHMSKHDDKYVITGHLVADEKKFDNFLISRRWAGVNFSHSGMNAFSEFMDKCHLMGHYRVLNNDVVYELTMAKDDKEWEDYKKSLQRPCMDDVITTENAIPQSTRYLSLNNDIKDIHDCMKENAYETAKALNENRWVAGNNWTVVNLSDGVHIVGHVNGKDCKLI